jgi:hypothetical protein
MQGCRERIQKTRELQAQIQQRSEEVRVQAKAAQAQRERERNSDRPTPENSQENANPRTNQGSSWSDPLQEENSSNPGQPNAAQLDAKFARWEMEMELEEMKRQLGR